MTVLVEPNGDWIHIHFPYDEDYVNRVKEVPGREYNWDTKTWLVPKPQWRRLKRRFNGVKISIPPEYKYEFAHIENPSWPSISEIKGLKKPLYPYETEGVGFLVTQKKCLLADAMGLGKTCQAIAASLVLRNRGEANRFLIFCPKTLIPQWHNEIKKFAGEDEQVITITGTKDQRTLGYRKAEYSFFVVTNYETVWREAEELASLEPDITVCDEVQRIKSYKAKTTRLIKKHFQTECRWGLTGTPLMNSLADLHSIMDWVNNWVLGPWWLFRNQHVIMGGYRNKQIVGYRNLREVHEQLDGWMLRRTKKKVLPELPPITVNNYYVEFTRQEWKLYNLIEKNLDEYYQQYLDYTLEHGKVLAQLNKLRRCCDNLALVSDQYYSSKTQELLDIIEDIGDEKVVVYSQWPDPLDLIAKELRDVEKVFAELNGSQTNQQRIDSLKHFQAPNCQVLLAQGETGGVGLNLQHATYVVNLELHWNPQHIKQRIARLHRPGQHKSVTCINLIVQDTVEEHVLEVMNEKTGLFQQVIEGDFSSPIYTQTWKDILERMYGGRRR